MTKPALARAALAWLAVGCLAPAITPRTAGAQTSQPAPLQGTDDAIARHLTRLALLDLRGVERPGPDDYAAACLALARAESFAPRDPELVRRRVEAAFQWGNQGELLDATRRLVALDPLDTVAQLRLISAQITQMQRVEDRLAAYDRFLSPAGARLDPSIRSRLALDAALLLRERGDEPGFADRLKLALKLDPTNKDASLLAYQFVSMRLDDLPAQGELLSNILLADPMDPKVHHQLASLLASGGAVRSARRFHANSREILARVGRPSPIRTTIETLVLDWLNEGSDKAIEVLQKDLDASRKQAGDQLRAMEAAGLDTRNTLRPDQVFLDPYAETVRIAAALAKGDAELATLSVRDLEGGCARTLRELGDPLLRPATMTPEDAEFVMQQALVRLQLWRCVTNIDVDRVGADLPRITEGRAEVDPIPPLIRGLVALRAGDIPVAKDLIQQSDTGDEWSAVALALLAESTGDRQNALTHYQTAASANPLSPLGALSIRRIAELQNALGLDIASRVAALESIGAGVPQVVDAMIRDPKLLQAMEVRLASPQLRTGEAPRIEVVIRNVAPFSLPLGAARTINTRLLISPSLDLGGRSAAAVAVPEMVDVERRLRLASRESFSALIDPDIGPTGWLAETLGTASTRSRWRVIQGFETRPDGTRQPGAGCVEGTTPALLRSGLDEAQLDAPSLAARIAEGPPTLSLLLSVRSRLVSSADEAPRRQLADALAGAYRSWPAKGRLLALGVLPPSVELPELAALDALLAEEQDPDVLFVAVLSRAAAADSPILARAKAIASDASAPLARLVAIHERRLADGSASYALAGTRLVTPARQILAGARKP